MELKTLVLGIFMSTLAFALKSGGGMTYLFSRSPNVRLQLLFSVLFAVGYGLVFGAAALLIHQVDLTAHLDLLQEFFKSGMTVHLIVRPAADLGHRIAPAAPQSDRHRSRKGRRNVDCTCGALPGLFFCHPAFHGVCHSPLS